MLKSGGCKCDEKTELTVDEYRLLRLLMEKSGEVLPSGQIWAKLWNCRDDYVDSNTLR
ncbi:winged helix family transcriptional regulator [Firmicutes bacterium OM08-11AC]|uniref:winged helix-turn-helix domain-containing protein n=1 Tax=Lachnospiraceae TaxID=186803 RepID=UPI000E4F35DD|nr:winged helix family transcriptional regulator [Blautia sp. AF32-4BH]RGI25340.1 winged helix family transcriptional regulator [Ruminococcus sp. OM08-13AT]RGI54499.1 winged helix family transcriptional regulator [Ruminococcus sp. OF05-2BH]RHU90163.1 winged helix family transcriptional regulator [Ruminococcus sp. OM08-7]RHU94027.1 winged helix family transcriptional regulator [Firmicutes bacterium OM08-11AC]